MIHTDKISLPKTHEEDIIDITSNVSDVVRESKIENGLVCVFVAGSTGAITTVEYEPGLVKDIPAALSRLFPRDIVYHHELRWHDGNGHSHVRASFLGPSLTVPINNGNVILGTWQQIVFLELDNKPRRRELWVQVMGE